MSLSDPPEALARDLEGTPYRWMRALARGGMGEVHVVEHAELGTRGVLKVLRRELQEHADLAARLRAEARLLTRLDHPNLVRVLDFGWTRSGRAFLVSELLEGESLGDRLRRDNTLSEPFALDIARQTLAGLSHVHAHGLVHRDVKPDNLFLVGPRGASSVALKILDFGVAKLLTDEARHAAGGNIAPTAAGMMVGTPYYMSPEQVLAAPVDARADVYGVGGVLYRMLVGDPPFTGRQLDVYEAHVVQAPRPPREAAKQPVSIATNDAILRALAKKKEDRFASADEMLAALSALARTEPLHGTPSRPMSGGTEKLDTSSLPRRGGGAHSSEEDAPTLAKPSRPASRGGRVVTTAMAVPEQTTEIGSPTSGDGSTAVSRSRVVGDGETRRLRIGLVIAIAVIAALATWILVHELRL